MDGCVWGRTMGHGKGPKTWVRLAKVSLSLWTNADPNSAVKEQNQYSKIFLHDQGMKGGQKPVLMYGCWDYQDKMRVWKEIDSYLLSPNFPSRSHFLSLLCHQKPIAQIISNCFCGFNHQNPRSRSEKEGKWDQGASAFTFGGYFGLTMSNMIVSILEAQSIQLSFQVTIIVPSLLCLTLNYCTIFFCCL